MNPTDPKCTDWLKTWRNAGVNKYTFPDGATVEFTNIPKLREYFNKYADKVAYGDGRKATDPSAGTQGLSQATPSPDQLEKDLDNIFDYIMLDAIRVHRAKRGFKPNGKTLTVPEAKQAIKAHLASKLKELESKAERYYEGYVGGEASFIEATPVKLIQEMLKEIE